MRIIREISIQTWLSLAMTVLLIAVTIIANSPPTFWWIPVAYGTFTLISLFLDFYKEREDG